MPDEEKVSELSEEISGTLLGEFDDKGDDFEEHVKSQVESFVYQTVSDVEDKEEDIGDKTLYVEYRGEEVGEVNFNGENNKLSISGFGETNMTEEDTKPEDEKEEVDEPEEPSSEEDKSVEELSDDEDINLEDLDPDNYEDPKVKQAINKAKEINEEFENIGEKLESAESKIEYLKRQANNTVEERRLRIANEVFPRDVAEKIAKKLDSEEEDDIYQEVSEYVEIMEDTVGVTKEDLEKAKEEKKKDIKDIVSKSETSEEETEEETEEEDEEVEYEESSLENSSSDLLPEGKTREVIRGET